ncbi:MAG: sulfite exporter TauE/SafE family protein [Actinobacteria bacterium]|nr:sulfite exporter TauE/SafE family protein [Actinomycetota bacterium]
MNLQTILIIAAAMGVGSFIKGATGQGLPQIAIPVMATFLGVGAAVVIMAIPGIITNTWLLWSYREHFRSTRDLPTVLLTGIAGAVTGTVLLDTLNENILSLTLAGMIALYVIVFFAHPDLRLRPNVTRFTSAPVGLAAGLLQGATGISGPLISTYFHGYRLPKQVYVLSISTIFQVYALVQAVTLAALGLYTSTLLVLSMLALVPAMVFLPLGAGFTNRLSRRTFDYIVLALLVASAAKIVYDVVQ